MSENSDYLREMAAHLIGAADEIDVLTDQTLALIASLNTANSQIATLSDTVTSLEDELIECQEGNQPIETLFGAYAQPQGRAAWDAFVQNVGPAKAIRLFYGAKSSLGTNLPPAGVTSIASLHSRTFGVTGGPTHAQVAAGAIDQDVINYANKVRAFLAANPTNRWIQTFIAEVDVAANRPLGTPQEYIAAYHRVRSKFDPIVEVEWGIIFTGTEFSDTSAARNEEDYWDSTYDIVGVDPYNMGYTDSTWKASLRSETQKAKDYAVKHGVPLMVPEFGSVWHDTDVNRRAGWITENCAMFKELEIDIATYFNADKTGESGSMNDHRNYMLTKPAEIEAYRAVLEG